MAKSENQKQKILHVKEFLERNSDPEHPVHAQQIVDYLQQNGIRAERKSIYDDLQTLQAYGMDVEVIRGHGCYAGSRLFELAELKLLVDAVQSCKSLTLEKSNDLISRLSQLASCHEAQHLRRHVVVSGRVKTMNKSILYNVDAIHEAIDKKRQITFDYCEWGIDRKLHPKPKDYVASPYELCWDEGNYYLIAYSERHGITHYRVDKMMHIQMLDAEIVENSMNLTNYEKRVFQMFTGELTKVRLRVQRSLINVIIDRFGTEQMLIPDGPDHFTITVEVDVSAMFMGWLARFGEQITIISPQSLIDRYREHLQSCLKQYQ